MKSAFLYNSPHMVHKKWAESINALFINDRDDIKIRNTSRLLKSFSTKNKIPKNTDLLLCEGGSQILSGALWKIKNRNKKLVLIVSDPKFFYLKKMGFLKKKLYMKALKHYDLFIPTSPLMSSLVPKNLKGKRKVVFPFFDKRFYKYKGDLNSKNMVFTGRVGLEKGVDILLDIYDRISNKFPKSNLYILGEGEIKDKLKKRKIKNVFFKGWVTKPEEYLKKSSIYMSFARIDPAGVAILEGMAMGIIPIVSKGVGYNYVASQINKKLVVKNPKDSINLVEKLWKDKKLMKRYSTKAREISRKYNKEKSIKLFKEAIRELNYEG